MRYDDCTIMVVGCGALGNEVLKNLVLMGVGHLVIVDFDLVEEGNLTRAILYKRCDVGRRKVDAAKKALLEINPALDVQTIFGDVAHDVGLGLVRRMDIIIGCVDNRWARYCIQRLCHRAGKTWVDGGILDLTGTVKVFRHGENCYACSLSSEALADMHRRMPCAGVIRRREAANHAPTTPLIASIIGAVQAQEALKVVGERCSVVGEHRPDRMFCYDGDTLTVMTPILEAWDDECPLHGEWNADEGEWLKVDTVMLDTPISGIFDGPLLRYTKAAKLRIILNEPFVDYIVSRRTNERYEVMLPAHRVEDFFTSNPRLRGQLMSDFYQHEYREIDCRFPYPSLTIRELGIPLWEELRVKCQTTAKS